jgi:hypothetical protein
MLRRAFLTVKPGTEKKEFKETALSRPAPSSSSAVRAVFAFKWLHPLPGQLELLYLHRHFLSPPF